MMYHKWADIYRDMFYVVLGPFSQKLPKAGGLRLLRAWLRALAEPFRLLKDYMLYGNKSVHGTENIDEKIWLLVGTKNNVDSLTFVKKGMKNAVLVGTNKKVQKSHGITRLSFQTGLTSWTRLTVVIKSLKAAFGSIVWQHPEKWTEGFGKLEAAKYILLQHRPQALIFTNDHGPVSRAFLHMARQIGIPTMYLQHASVSTYFPPLLFDHSLLEGQDSQDKYQECGPIPGQIHLIGMPKFDAYYPYINQEKTVTRLGICANILDDKSKLEATIFAIKNKFPQLLLSFRPHPRDDRRFQLPAGVSFSNAKEEGVFAFLCRQDMIIAGDTSTHLEAILLNVISIYFSFNELFADYYGYVRNGLVEKVENEKELFRLLEKYTVLKPDVRHKAKAYNAVVGTKHDGKSSELALQIIRNVLGK